MIKGVSINKVVIEALSGIVKPMEKYAKRRINGVKINDMKLEQRFVKGHFTATKRKIAVYARMSKTK